MDAEKQAKLKKQVEDKYLELKQKLLEGADFEERLNSVLLVAVAEVTILAAVVEELRDEVDALRLCLPKADVERAEKTVAKAKAKEAAR